MAAIDYTIPGQFKGVQIEPPENAMMRAMQLRGLQETSQMNALKAQEYQQDVMEKNALAQIYANPNLKYGSPEFFSAVAQRAPRYFEKIATGEQQRQLALSTQATREQQRQEAEQKQRLAKREFGLRKIASASDYGQAASLIERGIRTGEIDREEGDDMLSRLNPDTDIRQFRSDVITNLLPAEKALTAASDIEKAGLGVSSEKQKLESDKFKFQAEQVDTRLKEFNAAFPALAITSEKDVEARIRAMADDKVLGPLSQRFGSLDATIARNVAEYKRDPINYIKRLSGVSAADILKAAEEKQEKDILAAHDEHTLEASLMGRYADSYPEFKANYLAKQGAASAPAPEPAAAPTAAPTAESTAAVAPRMVEAQGFGRTVARPEAASADRSAAAAAADTTAEAASLPPVEVIYGIPGVSPAVVNLLRSTPEGRRKLAELTQAENSPANIAKRNLDSQRLQADITHRQAMEDIARRSENRQKDEAEERKRHAKEMEKIQRNQFYLLADKPNQIANTQVDDNGTITHFNARGQVIRSIPNAGKRSPALIKQEQARAESLRTIETLIPDIAAAIKPGGLLDQSTGSGAGRLVDYAAEFSGYATEGSIAISKLEPLAAMITMTVPRFEGPQSNRDVEQYRAAAGDLANPKLPAAKRKAAGEVVLRLMRERKNQFILKGMELDVGGTSDAPEPPAGFVRNK